MVGAEEPRAAGELTAAGPRRRATLNRGDRRSDPWSHVLPESTPTRSDPDRSLLRHLRAFEADVDDGAVIRRIFLEETRAAVARLPGFYFELGRRTDEAVESLADQLFAVAARRPRQGAPYLGRRPFRAWIELELDDAAILGQAVHGRRSLLRELLRAELVRARRRDPVLEWRDAVYQAAVGPRGAGTRAPPPGLVAPAEALERAAQQLPRSATPLVVVRLAQAAADELAALPPEVDAPCPDPQHRVAVEVALGRAWRHLSQRQQAVLAAFVRPGAATTTTERDPAADQVARIITDALEGPGAPPPRHPGGVLDAAATILAEMGLIPGDGRIRLSS